MNAPAPFRFSMVLTADASQAKAALQDVQGAVAKTTAETGRANQTAREQGSALDVMAAAAARAALQTDSLAAAEQRAMETRRRAQIGPVNVLAQPAALPSAAPAAIFRATDTAADSLRNTVSGLSYSLRASVDDMMMTTIETRNWREALDEVRASFNPLFAASKRYEMELDRIAAAERAGAISALEAAQARQRAATIIAPAGQGGSMGPRGPNNFNTANIAAQFNDIAVTSAMGMSPVQIALQQGTQLSQVFNQMGGGKEVLSGLRAGFLSMINPISLATIGVIAFGAAGIQWLMSLQGESKSAEDALSDLEAGIDRVAKANEAARRSMVDLKGEFGSSAASARELLAELAELERRSSMRNAETAMNSIFNDVSGGAMLGLRSQSDRFATLQRMFGEANWLNSGRVSETASPASFAVMDALQGVSEVAEGGDIDAQIAALEKLYSTFSSAASMYGEPTKEAENWLETIVRAQLELQKLQAQDENAAGTEAAKQMTRERQRQVELARTELRHGRDSAEVRAVEARHAQEAVAERIKTLGLTQADIEARRLLAAVSAEFALREALAAKARQDAQDTYLLRQSDQIAAIQLETRLLGATTAERQRAKTLAEAEIEIRERELGLLEAAAVRRSAIARADADAALARQRSIRDLQVRSSTDILDLQIGAARDPLSRANLQGQQEYARQIAAGAEADLAAANAAQVRAKSLAEALQASQGQAAAMTEEVSIRQRVSLQVAQGLVPAAEANRLIREELELRPLVAAAAKAEGDEKRALTEVIENLRAVYAAQAAEERRGQANDYLRAQAERIAGLRIELDLVGQTEAVRARVLTRIRAEQDIRRLGLDGRAADQIRAEAMAELELNRTIAARADAWGKVQDASESAIDAMLDLDIEGFADEISRTLSELAIRNPIKNAILGTEYGTLQDVGGLSGIWDRLTGRAGVDEDAMVARGTTPIEAMQITASHVSILASSIDLPGMSGYPGMAANLPGAPMGLPGSADVQSQVWSFFAQKGLKPHQIAGIMGNVAGESGFNPLAVGDNGTSFGLFQHHADRGKGLLNAVGGPGGLGNVQGQLEYVWQELMTTEAAAMRRLQASTNVGQATDAFMRGFERPSQGAMVDSWGTRLGAAEAAMSNFERATQNAGEGLGQLGDGFGTFGDLLSAGLKGGGKGLLGTLVGLGAGALGIPGFARGGQHDGGWRIVGEEGVELEATGPARYFTAAQTRDILSSGPPDTLTSPAQPMAINLNAAPAPQVNFQIINNTGQPVEQRETTDAQGNRTVEAIIGEQVGAAIRRPGGDAQRAISQTFNARRRGPAR